MSLFLEIHEATYWVVVKELTGRPVVVEVRKPVEPHPDQESQIGCN